MRTPLTSGQREDLLRRLNEIGDQSMILHGPAYTEFEIESHPQMPHGGGLVLHLPYGEPITPDQARRLASALLMCADWAEFGPGVWEAGKWRSRFPVS